MITYCHYPLVPFYVKNGIYRRYLHKFIVTDEVKGFNRQQYLDREVAFKCLFIIRFDVKKYHSPDK